MGSLGWYRCWWCWQRDEGGYIIDGFDDALCGPCMEWQGGPWEPTQRTRTTRMLYRELVKTPRARVLGPDRYIPGEFIKRPLAVPMALVLAPAVKPTNGG